MADDRGSVMQFEVDRKRQAMTRASLNDTNGNSRVLTARTIVEGIALTAMWDTMSNGGTFVLQVTDDKITVVQRPAGAEDPLA